MASSAADGFSQPLKDNVIAHPAVAIAGVVDLGVDKYYAAASCVARQVSSASSYSEPEVRGVVVVCGTGAGVNTRSILGMLMLELSVEPSEVSRVRASAWAAESHTDKLARRDISDDLVALLGAGLAPPTPPLNVDGPPRPRMPRSSPGKTPPRRSARGCHQPSLRL